MWTSFSPRLVRAALTGLLAWSVLVGCGQARPTPPPPPPSPDASASGQQSLTEGCVPADPRWTPLDGTDTPAATLGSGPAVVFANDSGNDVCAWLPLAESLAGDGFRATVFTYSSTSPADEAMAVTDTLTVASAVGDKKPYMLVGASLGGRIVIEAAAQRPPQLAGIISLSGERTVQNYRDILPDARRVGLPVLYVGAQDDPLTDGASQQQQLHDAMRGDPNHWLKRPGSAHGTGLITQDSDRDVVIPRIRTFLTQRLGAR